MPSNFYQLFSAMACFHRDNQCRLISACPTYEMESSRLVRISSVPVQNFFIQQASILAAYCPSPFQITLICNATSNKIICHKCLPTCSNMFRSKFLNIFWAIGQYIVIVIFSCQYFEQKLLKYPSLESASYIFHL